ncbi:MAG: L,D-transpeptidase family protein [Mogibacterium sp.]|nr:L,D-transpeptidase family protein [Mogibacterium sp.]
MKNKRFLSIISVMMLCVMLMTGAVFAEGEVPGAESGADAVQAIEQDAAQTEEPVAEGQDAKATETAEPAASDDNYKDYDEYDEDEDNDDETPTVDPSVRKVQKSGTFFTWTDLTVKFKSFGVVTSQPLDADNGPVQTKINAAKTSITVSWDKAADPSIAGYILLRAGKDEKYTELAVLGAGTTSYIDKTAKKKNTPYYYTVVGYRKDGSDIRISPCARWAAGETTKSKLKNAYSATLSKTAVTLQKGGTASIRLTVANASKMFLGSEIRFASDNEDVVKADDNGNLTATGVGTATVSGVIASGVVANCKVTVVGAFKPAAAQLSIVCATPQSIEIQWKKAQYATAYEVYCQTEEGSEFALLETTDKLSYVHEGLEAEHVYRYYVKSVNDNDGTVAKGNNSNIVEQAAVDRPRTFSEPVASAALTYGGTDNGVTVKWTMDDATGVSYYEILRGTSNDTASMSVIGKADAEALIYKYAQGSNGNFYYAVRAVGADGQKKTSPATEKVTVKAKGMLAVKRLVWRGKAKKTVSIYKEAGLHNKVGSVKKGTTVECIDKYPASVPKFHTPSKVKVVLSDGTTGWLRYSQLRGGVKAAINLKNDYTRSVKENYVNSMGYTSTTGYLVWISPYTQRAYTFTGSTGNWKLVRSDRVTTGRFSHRTPYLNDKNRTEKRGQIYKRRGKVNMVTEEGRKYYFRNASYFSPGVSLHTGTWWASGKRRGSVAKKPNTWGCVRMHDGAAKWIYHNVPMHTSVIVSADA